MEGKLERLRELRALQCCRHIDREIKSWLDKIEQPTDSETPNPLSEQTTKIDEIPAHDERAIDCFLANLKHLERLDSDATESTSSNDSYDEIEGFSHEEIQPKRIKPHPYMKSHHTVSTQRQQRMSTSSLAQHGASQSLDDITNAGVDGTSTHMSDLKQKAIWKWATERSRLASKWTWLQAQIADLEFRVRGQNDSLMQAKARKVLPIPQLLPENTCSRTYPLNKDFRQRRLIKSSQILSDSSKSSVKFSHVPCVCSSLPQNIAPCLSCKGRYNYLKQSEGESLPLLERASILDTGCHPVLSLPDDITLGSQLSYLLRQETVIRKPTKGKPGRKKGSTSANSAAMNDDKHTNKKGKFYQNIRQAGHNLKNPSQTMIASNKLKRKYRKHSANANYDSSNWFNGNYRGNNSTKRNKRIRSASSMNEGSLHSEFSNPYRPNHFTNNNQARTVTRRRRSEQSAYDIDNIVIPFSVAATARVEILEYKEIMTPSWRVWENGTCLSDKNNVATELPEEDIEDTSDEAYIQRHTKGEHEEKKRFSLKPPPKNESHNAVPRE